MEKLYGVIIGLIIMSLGPLQCLIKISQIISKYLGIIVVGNFKYIILISIGRLLFLRLTSLCGLKRHVRYHKFFRLFVNIINFDQ